ncbi:MAG: tRNA (N6-isopentenyl adenosine(37)-C2)-methylthiotransferase MiaB [Bacteroidota bacterium]
MNITPSVFIETFGCQMNFSDSEIVASVMKQNDYTIVHSAKEAHVIFLNTCSIRENAEQRIRGRLRELKALKKKNPTLIIGILGCMAERLKETLLKEEQMVDLIAGPDAYRSLPDLIAKSMGGIRASDVMLSGIETYDDITPIRYDSNGISAFISIMRGCQNFCSYCVVPYTRGKERSRNPETIVAEAQQLFEAGYRDITLLGQNVNSYTWKQGVNFSKLIEMVALINPLLRVRFATSHPKDLSDELIMTIAKHENICRSIHLPLQSGSTQVLERMNRGYSREFYMNRIETIRKHIPDCGLSTDLIAGFCGETEEDHQQTLSLIEWAGYDLAYLFAYSERPDTYAAENLKDDVAEETKSRRLSELIKLQREISHQSNMKDVGTITEVLVEGRSKRSELQLSGRNSRNKVVVFPKMNYNVGDYVKVKITSCTTATLIGEVIG